MSPPDNRAAGLFAITLALSQPAFPCQTFAHGLWHSAALRGVGAEEGSGWCEPQCFSSGWFYSVSPLSKIRGVVNWCPVELWDLPFPALHCTEMGETHT